MATIDCRQREILFRHGLAEKLTPQSRSMKPRLVFSEVNELIESGLLSRDRENRVRLTALGLAEVRGELANALGMSTTFACEFEVANG